MCEQCNTDSEIIGEVVPGLFLIQAKKNGRHMSAGDYGLVQQNDPDVIWRSKPVPDPYEGMTDDEIDAQDGKAFTEWRNQAREFTGACKGMTLTTSFRLGLLCQAAGYDFKVDGSLEQWLFHRMGVLLQAGSSPAAPP